MTWRPAPVEVVKNSSQFWTNEDLKGMVPYLKSLTPQTQSEERTALAQPEARILAGRAIYGGRCSAVMWAMARGSSVCSRNSPARPWCPMPMPGR